jgi:hypothetical protein
VGLLHLKPRNGDGALGAVATTVQGANQTLVSLDEKSAGRANLSLPMMRYPKCSQKPSPLKRWIKQQFATRFD